MNIYKIIYEIGGREGIKVYKAKDSVAAKQRIEEYLTAVTVPNKLINIEQL